MSVSKFGEEGRVWYLQTQCEPRCLGHECPEASSKSLPLSQLWGDRVRGGCMLGSYLEIPCGRGNCRGTEGICSVIFSEPAEETVSDSPSPDPDLTGVAALMAAGWCHYTYPSAFGRKNCEVICYFIFRCLWSFMNLLIKMSGVQRKWQIKCSCFYWWSDVVIRLNIHGKYSCIW